MDGIFEKSEGIISDIINRFVDCMQIEEICVFGDVQNELERLYKATRQKKVRNFWECEKQELTYIHIDYSDQLKDIWGELEQYRKYQNFIIYVADNGVAEQIIGLHERICKLSAISLLQGDLILIGPLFNYPVKEKVPEGFRALAILHFYNEADIIEMTINYLLSQGIDVYLVDNWSDDGSYEIATRIYSEYPDRIFLERFPQSGKTEYYEWYNQLERTEQIAKELQYDWYMHYDADELRISPWKGCSLIQTLYRVDQLGYNLIENSVIEHKITNPNEDIFMTDAYFDFGHRSAHFQQTKTWKKTDKIELKRSGGHLAMVDNPKLFPLKILNRHYPLRSVEQAKRKICVDRKPRFEKEKKVRGWHGHYDSFDVERDIVNKKECLLKWNEEAFNDLYVPLFMGCGIKKVESICYFNCECFRNKRVILFGAGNWGKQLYVQLESVASILLWVDSASRQYGMIYGEKIQSPDAIDHIDAEYIIVAIKSENARKDIREVLFGKGIGDDKIKYI